MLILLWLIFFIISSSICARSTVQVPPPSSLCLRPKQRIRLRLDLLKLALDWRLHLVGDILCTENIDLSRLGRSFPTLGK